MVKALLTNCNPYQHIDSGNSLNNGSPNPEIDEILISARNSSSTPPSITSNLSHLQQGYILIQGGYKVPSPQCFFYNLRPK